LRKTQLKLRDSQNVTVRVSMFLTSHDAPRNVNPRQQKRMKRSPVDEALSEPARSTR